MKTVELNKYKVKWAIIKPHIGFITLQDQKILGVVKPSPWKKELAIPFKGIIEVDKKLSKPMKVLTILDAQVGKMDVTHQGWWNAALEVATTKQKSEVYEIS